MAISGLLHLVLVAGLLFLHQGTPSRESPEVSARVRFVKAAPPRQRPLTRRVLAAPLQRPLVRRQQAHSVPTQAEQFGPVTSSVGSRAGAGGSGSGQGSGEGDGLGPGEGGGGFLSEGTGSLGQGLPPGSGLDLGGGAGIGPGLQAGAVGGQRTEADEIDLALELLGVEALDTGQHRALVIVDPRDRRSLKGFLYLSSIYSESIQQAELESDNPRRYAFDPRCLRQVAEREALQGLADRMSERTGVRTQVLDGLSLDDPRLAQVPFLLLTINDPFTFTAAEAQNLGRYLLSGGFLYAEIVRTILRMELHGFKEDDLDVLALREFIRTAFQQVGYSEGKDWYFARLEQDHPLYHCYYDINSLPRGFRDIWFWYHAEQSKELTATYLEGIMVHGQMVGIYSLKGYADFWAGQAELIRERDRASNSMGIFSVGGEELKPYDLGVNVLVYALTREGALARQMVSAE